MGLDQAGRWTGRALARAREVGAALVGRAGALARERASAAEQANDDVFRRALDALLDDVVITRAVRDAGGRIVDFRFTHANHRRPDTRADGRFDRVGMRLTEVYPAAAESGLIDRLRQVVETGEPFVAEEMSVQRIVPEAPDDWYMRIQVVPFGDGYLATTRLVTEEVQLRQQIMEARLLAEQERVAVEVLQEVALPGALPDVPGLEMAAAYLPATTDTPVGGDWYDVVPTVDGRIVLVVGDVAGHGRDSAVQMVQARSLVRALAGVGEQPGAVLAEVNRLLRWLWDGQTFATCLLVSVDAQTGRAVLACAGHPPPLMCAPSSCAFVDLVAGTPLGSVVPMTYPEVVVDLEPGAVVVLYTDGLVESRTTPIGEGMEALCELVSSRRREGAQSLCEVITAAGVPADRPDDVCVLTVCWDPPDA